MARLQKPLLCFLQRRLSSEDAEDVLQETFLAGYRSIKSYDPAWRFATWIYTISHRRMVSFRRKKSFETVEAFDAAFDLPAHGNGPLDRVVQLETQHSLWAMADRILDADAFTAVWLTYVEGMSAEEVGAVIGRNANAVRLLLTRSRARLSERLPSGWRVDET